MICPQNWFPLSNQQKYSGVDSSPVTHSQVGLVPSITDLDLTWDWEGLTWTQLMTWSHFLHLCIHVILLIFFPRHFHLEPQDLLADPEVSISPRQGRHVPSCPGDCAVAGGSRLCVIVANQLESRNQAPEVPAIRGCLQFPTHSTTISFVL